MLRLFRTIVLFSIPYCLVAGWVVVVDPFMYFGNSTLAPSSIKEKISPQVNYALWKLNAFHRHPAQNIILGDSRTARIDPVIVEKYTGNRYANLSYGGGNLAEALDTYWYASQLVNLETVYIGVNIDTYNGSNTRSRVKSALPVLESVLLYMLNRDVLQASWMVSRSWLTGTGTDLEKPPMGREAFWTYQLDVTTKRYFATYRYPSELKRELERVARQCEATGTKLVFLVPPTHVDVQETERMYGLVEARARFLKDIADLGTVFDFDYASELTMNRRNFLDPFHLQKERIESLITEVWGEGNGLARVLDRANGGKHRNGKSYTSPQATAAWSRADNP
jgi:hypothetical protein